PFLIVTPPENPGSVEITPSVHPFEYSFNFLATSPHLSRSRIYISEPMSSLGWKIAVRTRFWPGLYGKKLGCEKSNHRRSQMKRILLKLSLAIVPLGFLYDGPSASSLATQSQSVQDANDLVESIRRGDLKGVERLLAAGVDVNDKKKDGDTALAVAAGAHRGSDQIVELLLAGGQWQRQAIDFRGRRCDGA